jgi:hypothetical protein
MHTWVSAEFRRHGIPPSKQNSINTKFRRHGIPFIFFTSIYSVCYAVIYFLFNFDGISSTKYAEFRRILRNFVNFNSQSLQYVRI